MKTSWLQGLTDQQKKDLRIEFSSSTNLRKRLIQLLEDKADEKRKKLRNSDNYEKASWALEQADGIGYERAIFEVISLIESSSVEK